MTPRSLVVVVLAASGCIADGQELIDVPLSAAGTRRDVPILAREGVTVTLEEARLAFGPLYLCAGTSAGDLCDTARIEWIETAVVDALDPAPNSLGELVGVSGEVRSFMYDLGISSALTEQRPVVLDAAGILGNASVRVEGTANLDGLELPFSAKISIQQDEQTERGIPVVRSGTDGRIDREVGPDEPGLRITFDAAPWVADIDFTGALEDEVCTAGGRPLVCAGMTEQTCDPDGGLVGVRDCVESSEICVAGQGCVERYEFEEEGQPARALRSAIVAGPPPTFRWGVPPTQPGENR